MPIRDVTTAGGKSLDNDYGATKGPNAPLNLKVHLFIGDPTIDELDGGGVEVTTTTDIDDGLGGTVAVANGYTVPTVPNDGTTWLASSNGVKLSNVISFGTSLEAYPGTVTHYALESADTPGEWWDCGPLLKPLDVTGAGSAVEITIAIQYDDNVEEAE